MFIKEKSVIVIFMLFTNIFGMSIDSSKIRGVQIKNKGKEHLLIEMSGENNFVLPSGQMASLIVEDTWSGKIVSRSEECETKKCNTPFTEAQLVFNGANKEDQYSVSVQNGFNKPIVIQPYNPYNYCKPVGCSVNLLQQCPQNLQVKNEEEKIVGCKTVTGILPPECLIVITSQEDEKSNTYSCKANTYIVSIG